VVDHRILYVLTFNFTYLDMDNSRSFGLITEDQDLVHEASKLFHADIRRQPYTGPPKNFIVSPVNARHELAHFIKGAKKQLLIYDPEISDRPMIGLLRDRAREGVAIRIIGRVTKPSAELDPGRLMRMRFHTRTIIRDRQDAFLGSQSLREAELDRRRELGLITSDHAVVASLLRVFQHDWATLAPADAREEHRTHGSPETRKAVKALVRQLPLAPMVASALQHAAGEIRNARLDSPEFQHSLADALKDLVEDAVAGRVHHQTANGA